MKTIEVALGARSYPIYIGSGLLERGDVLAPHIAGRQVLVVTNETVGPLYLERVLKGLHGFECASIELPDGEQYKTLETLGTIFDALLGKGFDRDTTLIALGGGVVGDITGFAAACYQRGVNYLQVPTTLLAQVDASVGGKTAVNHPLGKNMIGAFHQPRAVVIDTGTLATLAGREFRAGLAEVIKYGLIRDQEFFAQIERDLSALVARDTHALIAVIERSCRNKAEIVASDERERGTRALLNLGHTFGHAIETGTGYGAWLHGEAVAAGMCMAARLSERLGWLRARDVARIEDLIQRAGLPTAPPVELDKHRIMQLMKIDKKAKHGAIRLVLLQRIGHAVLTAEYPEKLLAEVLDSYGAGA